MNGSRSLFTLFLLFFLASSLFTAIPTDARADGVTIYFFYGDGCPHCEREKPFIEEMKRRYPELQVRSYEVWHNRANAEFFSRLAGAYGFEASGVPATFIGDMEPVIGFSHDGTSRERIEKGIRSCLERGCPDPAERLKLPPGQAPPSAQEDRMVNVPWVGLVDASKMALPLLTVVLGGLDSFNPCAFFVLFTLLGMLVHAGTRGRMLLIGGVFVFFSGFMYFLFMSAWLNFFLYVGEFKIMTAIAGVIALGIAGVNIKDFFFFKRGISLVIPEAAKPKLFERMRGLLKATSILSMLVGAAILAVAANTYELLCTAGFPMVFTRILTLHDLSRPQYYLYLVFYNVVYIVPLAVIVLVATFTLGARKLSERQGRNLKLVSGLMMLCLGVALLVDPALFSNIYVSAGLLFAALAAAWVLIRIRKDDRKSV